MPLAKALVAGGISAIELTLRTEAALDAMRSIVANVPEILVGAGTVISTGQVEAAQACGAAFGVSPGFSAKVVAAARKIGFPFAPGVMTPSDIQLALEHRCSLLKYFPAESGGGLDHLRSMAAPFVHRDLKFIPLGGIGPENAANYLQDPLILAIGGSWIAPRTLIQRRDWDAIGRTAREAMVLARKAAQKGAG